jgi:hypothetical protein
MAVRLSGLLSLAQRWTFRAIEGVPCRRGFAFDVGTLGELRLCAIEGLARGLVSFALVSFEPAGLEFGLRTQPVHLMSAVGASLSLPKFVGAPADQFLVLLASQFLVLSHIGVCPFLSAFSARARLSLC